MIRGVEALDSG